MEKKSLDFDGIIALLLTSGTVPVFSRILDLYFGVEINEWKTERILLLYVSCIVGFILSEQIMEIYKRTKLYKIGYTWGDSDAISNLMVIFPALIILWRYESVVWMLLLLVLIILSVISCCNGKIHLQLRKRFYFLFIIYFMLLFSLFFIMDSDEMINYWKFLFPCQIAVCFLWDSIKVVMYRIKKIFKKNSDL